MNTRGGQEGHLATTANDSVTGQILCITISWDAIKEANIEKSFFFPDVLDFGIP